MRAINVRCGCNPGLVLGSMILPSELGVGHDYVWYEPLEAVAYWLPGGDIELPAPRRVTMRLRRFMGRGGHRELAFDSNTHTLEQLRHVTDFAEICQVPE